MEWMDAKDKYFLWNDAFVDYFFKKGNDSVKLYIDENIIEHVGETIQDKYTDENHHSERILQAAEQIEWIGHSVHVARFADAVLPKSNLRRFILNSVDIPRETLTIGRLAEILSSKETYSGHILPCLSLALIVLFLFKQSGYNDTKINGKIYQYLKDFKKDEEARKKEFSLKCIPNLFKSIKEHCPTFDLARFGEQAYVSLLKYQLQPTPTQTRQIEYAVYRAKLKDGLSYSEKITRMWPFVEKVVQDKLFKRSFKDEVTKQCITHIIEEFSLDNYQNGTGRRVESYETILAIELGEDESSDRVILLSDFNESDIEDENYKIQKGGSGLVNWIYNPNPIQYKCNGIISENVTLQKYNFKIGDYNFKAQDFKDVVFFQKYGDYYLQTRDLYLDAETVVAVKNKKRTIECWENWARENVSSFTENDYWTSIRGLDNDQWKTYDARDFKNQYFDDCARVPQIKHVEETIEKDGGIGINECYLQNALPYFMFPEQINEDNLSISMLLDDVEPSFVKIIKDNRLVLDLLDFDAKEKPSTLQVLFEYKTENNTNISKRFEFDVQAQNVRYENADLYKLNKWGEIIADEPTEEYLAGSLLHRPYAQHDVFYDLSGIKPVRKIDEFDQCYFINLLAALSYYRKGKPLGRDVVLKCLKYAANRNDLLVSEEDFRHIRRVLVNSSYVAYNKERSSYQVLPPTFVRLPRNKQGRHLYLLTGCYTYKFISDLWDYLTNVNNWREDLPDCNKSFMYVKENVDHYMRIDDVLPELFIFERFNFEEFKEQYHHDCEVLDHDIAYDLLNFSPTINDYEGSLRSIGRNDGSLHFKDSPTQTYPRVRVSKANGYHRYRYIEMPDTDLRNSNISDETWMQIYCKYIEEGASSFMADGVEENHVVHFYFPYRLPYILQRALYLINIGQPQVKKTFICNNCMTSDVLYTVSKCYVVDACYRDRISEILTGQGFRDNPKITIGKIKDVAFKIELWKTNILKKGMPRKLLVLYYHNKIIAYGTISNEVFVKHEYLYHKVDGNVNQVFSNIILSDKNYTLLFDEFQEKCLSINSDLYNKELINIIS